MYIYTYKPVRSLIFWIRLAQLHPGRSLDTDLQSSEITNT